MVAAMSLRLAAASAVLAAGVAGCEEPQAPPPTDDSVLAGARADDYAKWARPPNREVRVATAAPHGRHVDIYINEVVAADLAMQIPETGLLEWSEGATIVLEGFAAMDDAEPVQIAAMEKRHGSWRWEQYDAADLESPRFEGRPDLCLGCHAAGEDFVRSFKLPDAPKME